MPSEPDANGHGREVRCPDCGRLLFRTMSEEFMVEIKCKCRRIVTVAGYTSRQRPALSARETVAVR